jgi:hypothetical protein
MRVISGITGLILILTAVVIIILSTGDNSYAMKKEQLVAKYITNANQALVKNNYVEAINFAKMAIQADPKNNNGFMIYNKIMEAKFKPTITQEKTEDNEDLPVKKVIQAAPDMGC